MTYVIDGATQRDVDVNGVRLSVYEAGPASGPAVVFSHGFPELAYSWRHQLAALGAAGYHAIAPDQRGYGGSDRPDAVEAYDIFHLTGDLAALVGALGHDQAVFAGHDWGGLIVWQMALLQGACVAGVIGINTPFIPRWPTPPIELFRSIGGDQHYIVQFQQPGIADRALAADVDATFRGMMRGGVPSAETPGALLLSDAELAVYVGAFTQTGFTGGLNWYRNFDRNWRETPEQDGATVEVPALMVTAEWDAVLPPAMAEGMPAFVPDLETHMIERCGHWTQQEHPDELNAILLEWLGKRFPS